MRDIITKLEELNVEKPQLNEGLADMAHEAEKDHEVQMARSDCYKSAKYAVAIHKMLKDVSEMEGIDGWVAAKITKAADYLGSVKHYMEGQAMSDVELAVVPVAGDMTDAMTMEEKEECRYCGGDCPNDEDNACDGYLGDIDGLYAESVEVIEAEERDYICVHAKKGKYECSGTSSYAAAKKAAEHWGLKSTAGIDAHLADEKKTATESIAEGRLGFSDLEEFGSEWASWIDMEARRRGSADMEPGDADELRYEIAKEMGLVSEEAVNEDREVMVRATNIDYDGPALDKLPTDVNVKVMVNPGDSEDEIFDMVADELEDRYGVKVSGFDMAMMEQDAVEEDEDIIGDIIGKLGKGVKAGAKSGRDVIGDIIAKLPKDDKNPVKQGPRVSMQQQQKQANSMAMPKTKPIQRGAPRSPRSMEPRSMAQDTTRPLTQSKFSEWSKK